jgi:DNA adenine methylase
MKPILSYYGGKQRLAKRISDIIMGIDHTVYVEPFAGGAAVLFVKPKIIPSNRGNYRECINDINNEIIDVYRACQDYKEELLHLLENTPYSQEEYSYAKHIMDNKEEFSLVRRAWAVIILTRQSFAKGYKNGWGTARKGTNDAVTWYNYKQKLPEILNRLRDVYISNEDAIKCIHRWDSENTLFYLDPPYINSECKHYKGYTKEDYVKLLDTLTTLRGKYILSNYQQEIEPSNFDRKVEYRKLVSVANTVRKESKEILYIKDGRSYE